MSRPASFNSSVRTVQLSPAFLQEWDPHLVIVSAEADLKDILLHGEIIVDEDSCLYSIHEKEHGINTASILLFGQESRVDALRYFS